MKKFAFILSIILLGGIIRFWHLSTVPPALNSDEVAIGYNAYSLLITGRDEYGERFPLTFRSFDDYKMPLYVYAVTGSIAIFGYNDFAIRFPSAFFGTLTIYFTYVLVRKLFSKNVALLSALFLSVSPWHVYFSRAGYEANVATFFIVLGIYLLLIGLTRGWALPLAAFVLSLSVWTYLTPRIFVPLLVIGLGLIYRKSLWRQKRMALLGLVIAIVMLLPIIKISISREGQMRAQGVSAFASPDVIKKSANRLLIDNGPLRIFDNRRILYAITFLRGYFAHFDANFLFLDKAIEKYRAPDTGLLYIFELPLMIAGSYWLMRHWNAASAVIFWWILIAPVAAAFTLQLPHPVRTLVFLPSFHILSAIGLNGLWNKFKRLQLVYIVIIFISIMYYIHQYFTFLPIENAQFWYWGRRELAQKITAYESRYDKIIVSNALDVPYIFYLYYRPIDPKLYLTYGGTVSGGFNEQENKYQNIEFRSIHESQRNPLKKILFAGLPSEVFDSTLIVDTIYNPDGSPAIILFE